MYSNKTSDHDVPTSDVQPACGTGRKGLFALRVIEEQDVLLTVLRLALRFLPPPACLFTVDQARRSASSFRDSAFFITFFDVCSLTLLFAGIC
jgi:hypothetical protein